MTISIQQYHLPVLPHRPIPIIPQLAVYDSPREKLYFPFLIYQHTRSSLVCAFPARCGDLAELSTPDLEVTFVFWGYDDFLGASAAMPVAGGVRRATTFGDFDEHCLYAILYPRIR
jgi:hypothetical protein